MSEPLKPSRKSWKKPLAVAFSLGLHAILVVFLAVSSTSQLANLTVNGDGTSDVEGIQLDLVGVHDSEKARAEALKTPPPSPDAQRINGFMQMTDHNAAPDDRALPQPGPPKSLAEAIGENPFQPQSAGAPAPKRVDEAHTKVDKHSNKTANDLWKAIEPCWNRLADKSTLSVTLEVSFSPLGNLAKPPVIKRDATASLNETMMRSENQAITALSQCGPYLMAYGQDGVEIQFPGRRG